LYLARNYERHKAIQVTQNPPLMELKIIGVCVSGPEIKKNGWYIKIVYMFIQEVWFQHMYSHYKKNDCHRAGMMKVCRSQSCADWYNITWFIVITATTVRGCRQLQKEELFSLLNREKYENWNILGSSAISIDKCLATFRGIVLPSSSGLSSQRTVNFSKNDPIVLY